MEIWTIAYDESGDTISVNRLITRGEIFFNKLTYNVYAKFNPTIKIEKVINNNKTTEVIEAEYGQDKSYAINAANGYVIESITVDDTKVANITNPFNYTQNFTKVVKPHKIVVEFSERIKEVAAVVPNQTANNATDLGIQIPENVNYKVVENKIIDTQEHNVETILGGKLYRQVITLESNDGYIFADKVVAKINDVKTSASVSKDFKHLTIHKDFILFSEANNAPTLNVRDAQIKAGTKLDLTTLIDEAHDIEDGNILNGVVIDAGGFNYEVAGKYEITFTAIDKDGAMTTKIATVEVLPVVKANSKSKIIDNKILPKTGSGSVVLIGTIIISLGSTLLVLNNSYKKYSNN